MTIKLKLLGGGMAISLLLVAVLGLTAYSFSSLSGGFADVVEKSATGVDNSRSTQAKIISADSHLSADAEDMLAVVDDISQTNMQVKVLERKIKQISTEFAELVADLAEVAEEMPDGIGRDSLEDASDAIGDVEEIMRREALVSLNFTVGKMAEFTEAIGTQVESLGELNAELGKVKQLSGDVVIANRDIRALAENFSGEISLSRNVIAGVLLLTVLVCLLGAVLLTRAITRPLNRLNEIARGIADGDLAQTVDIVGKDEMGQLGESMSVMIKNLKRDIEETRRRADEASRIQMALDVCSTNVMVADVEQRIIYQNKSSRTTLEHTRDELTPYLPNLDLDDLIGSGMGDFHNDPKARQQVLEQLDDVRQDELQIGGRSLRLIATPVVNQQGERLGTAMEWLDRTDEVAREAEKAAQQEADARSADENLRIRVALDNVSSGVMMADPERRILYINRAASRLFSDAEADIRNDLPDFRADGLLGGSIDAFHRNPAHQAQLLNSLNQPHEANLTIGGRTLRFIANPVINDAGERLGTAVEWTERTVEVAVEAEVQAIVAAAQDGDLSQRIAVEDKEGFFKGLGQGINALIAQVERIFNELSGVMAAMAQGDLTHSMHSEYRGSFEDLKGHVNGTLDNLKSTLGQLRESMDDMRTTADEISTGNNSLSARTEQQASRLEQTASSMEELTGTVRNTADNAQQANTLASQARAKAQQGGEVVGRAVQAMAAINSASSKIAEIIGVIDAIAFQTNLLALNASVEAARAGEQGRGFAVVATEVRNLAGRSATAAKEIKELIKDSGEKVELGAALVNESGATLEQIVGAVQKVGDIIAKIAAASAEQTSGIDQVNQAVTSMDEMTQQNAALAEQTSAASASMSDKAQELNEAIGRFRL